MNLFKLAAKQLKLEGKPLTWEGIFPRALKIRRWLDSNTGAAEFFMGIKTIANRQQKYYYAHI
jgi:hypothetical protein